MARKITNILRRLGLILMAVCILAIVCFSLVIVPKTLSDATSDKFLHTIAYAALGFSMYLSFMPLEKSIGDENDSSVHLANSITFMLLLLFAAGLVFGFAMEIIQGLVGRDCSMMDLAADSLGLIMGFAFCYLFLGSVNSLLYHLPN